MKAAVIALVLAAGTLVASVLVVAAPVSAPRTVVAQEQASPASDPGTALFKQMCSDCHEATRIVEGRRTKDEWQEVLNKMIQEGATGSGQDFENVFSYLLRNYGRVQINTATPDELMRILLLSKAEADAVIAYRAAHGKFSDLEAVKAVPDVDAKKIELHRDAISF